VSAIKNAVYESGPVIAWLNVYTDFFYYSSGVYSYAWGQYESGHFVVITGWDDSDQAFIAKNSWNTDWGENGYFRIAYSELNGVTEFGRWTYAYHAETLSEGCLILQNETIGGTKVYGPKDCIRAGSAYTVESGGDVTMKAGIIYLEPGFRAKKGSKLHGIGE